MIPQATLGGLRNRPRKIFLFFPASPYEAYMPPSSRQCGNLECYESGRAGRRGAAPRGRARETEGSRGLTRLMKRYRARVGARAAP